MAQYKVPIHFSRKMILFFYFYQKTFMRLKWTNALRCSHSFFIYFIFGFTQKSKSTVKSTYAL